MSILTLQFGSYSNYVGSHYWNFQDELSGPAYQGTSGDYEFRPELLYRTSDSKGATPNVLIFDAAGSDALYRAGRGQNGSGSLQSFTKKAPWSGACSTWTLW